MSTVTAADPLDSPSRQTVDELWALLDRLHDADLVHRAISPEQLALGADGRPVFVDLGHAVLASDVRSRSVDRAQLLATTLLLVDAETAIEAFLDRHGADVEPMLRYLQPAVVPAELRRALKAASVDLDVTRGELATRAGVEQPELEKVRRVTRGAVVTTLLVGFAAMFLVSTFADLDWAEIRNALERGELVVADLRVRHRPVDPARGWVQHARCVPYAIAPGPGLPVAVLLPVH